jgi:tetratricopeptide (TPR) repeat protein
MEDRLDNADRDKFIEELDEKLKRYKGLQGDPYKESLREQFILAKHFYEFLLRPDGSPDSQLFYDIAMSIDADVAGWIVELPFALGGHGGMVEEAVEIGNLFAKVHSPDNFFGDMAVILAEAGRREEAFDRISKNLEMFPDDVWVIIKAGDAFYTLKEADKALELYNRAYGMTSPLSYDRDGVLERLVPLLRELGRETEADALVESEEKAEKARVERYERRKREETNYTPIIGTPKQTPPRPRKVGRNEPCPCGSGKKYKKCCGK